MAEDDSQPPLHKLTLSDDERQTQQSGPSDVAYSAHVAAVQDTPVDPTLIDALGNPRERMNVLKFEDIIASFVQSRDDVLETPPLSSYHRLLVYRLASRFQLEHAKSENISMEPDKHAICLYKTMNTTFPKSLLIHMTQSTPAGDAPPTQPQPTKIKLMKRASSDTNRPSRTDKDTQSRSNVSMSERERQYAEARARIFGTTSPSPSNDGNDADASTGESNPTIARDRSRSPTSTEGDERSTDTPTASSGGVIHVNTAPGTKGPRRKVVNPGTWQGKKGVLRDKEAEKNDPDFRRHHHVPAYRSASPSYAPYGAPVDPHMARGTDGSWMHQSQHVHASYSAGMHYNVYGMEAYQQYYHQGYQQPAQVPRPPPSSSYDYNQEFPPLK